MDLIDVLRIAAHRWYVVMVILLVGVTASLVLASSVAPTYKVETQSILISGQVPTVQTPLDEPANPYLAFTGSLYPTLSAVTRTVDGQEYRDPLTEGGPEHDFELSTSQEAPVIITEATAATPEGAVELSAAVQAALSETLATLQAEESVPEAQQIFMRDLTTSKPEQEVGNRNRVLLGGIGLTLAAAIGGAVLVESIIQMRSRSRQTVEDGASEDDETIEDGGSEDDQSGDVHGSGASDSKDATPGTEGSADPKTVAEFVAENPVPEDDDDRSPDVAPSSSGAGN